MKNYCPSCSCSSCTEFESALELTGDPVTDEARLTLARHGIPYGQAPPRQETCSHGRAPVDCDTCAILAYLPELDKNS